MSSQQRSETNCKQRRYCQVRYFKVGMYSYICLVNSTLPSPHPFFFFLRPIWKLSTHLSICPPILRHIQSGVPRYHQRTLLISLCNERTRFLQTQTPFRAHELYDLLSCKSFRWVVAEIPDIGVFEVDEAELWRRIAIDEPMWWVLCA